MFINCFVACSIQSTDLIIVLDLSGSTQEQYEIVTSFALELVHGLDLSFGRTRVGVVTFSTEARNEFFLFSFQDRQSILNRMRFEHYGGRTNIYQALRLVTDEQLTQQNGDRTGVRNLVVLVSDGDHNEESHRTLAQAEALKARDAELYTIAIGQSPNFGDLNQMSSNPDSQYVIRLQTLDQVRNAADILLGFICGP